MDSSNRLQHIINCLVDYRKLWLGATILGLLAATMYAFLLKGESWTSRQTMIIRDDLLGQTFKPGTFVSQEAMKSAQETLLETARRPEVIRSTLEKLGPETKRLLGLGGGGGSSWLDDQTIEDYRGSVSFESANGGEIGKSDVIVLAAKSSSAERSKKFLSLLLDEVDSKLSEVQGDRFESMEAELRATCESNAESRQVLAQELIAMEREIGSDIGLIRSLVQTSMSSPSAFEEERNQILLEKRNAIEQRDTAIMLKESLEQSARKSLDEIPTSAELLAMQPQLAELSSGLAAAKQDLSIQEGRFEEAHPALQDAKRRVKALQDQIRSSLPLAIRGLSNQIAAREEVVNRKQNALDLMQEKQNRVSEYRVPYATKSQDLEKQTSNLSDAQASLARMQSRKMASDSIKLLTRIGEPWTGTRADGLGKKALAIAGGLGGLLIGLGLVMIVAPPYREPDVNAAVAQDLADEETVSEQRLAEQLVDVLPSRSQVEAHRESVAEPVAPVVQTPVFETPTPTPEVAPTQPLPTIQVPTSATSAGIASAAAATAAAAAASAAMASVTSVTDAPAMETPVTETPPAPVTHALQDASDYVTIDTQRMSSQTQDIETKNSDRGYGDVAPVDLESATPFTDPGMAPATAEQAYLAPTPRADVQPEPQVAPVQYPTTPQAEASAVPAHPALPTQNLATPPASQTLASIFANMPQPRTDLDVDDGGSEVEVEEVIEDATSSERIADRILDVTDQQMSETQIPEPQAQTQESTAESKPTIAVRKSADTIQLGANGIQPSTDAIPLQRRASYRPVDLARVEDEPAVDEELSERSIDSVFSQLKQPESQRDVPTEPYGE